MNAHGYKGKMVLYSEFVGVTDHLLPFVLVCCRELALGPQIERSFENQTKHRLVCDEFCLFALKWIARTLSFSLRKPLVVALKTARRATKFPELLIRSVFFRPLRQTRTVLILWCLELPSLSPTNCTAAKHCSWTRLASCSWLRNVEKFAPNSKHTVIRGRRHFVVFSRPDANTACRNRPPGTDSRLQKHLFLSFGFDQNSKRRYYVSRLHLLSFSSNVLHSAENRLRADSHLKKHFVKG